MNRGVVGVGAVLLALVGCSPGAVVASPITQTVTASPVTVTTTATATVKVTTTATVTKTKPVTRTVTLPARTVVVSVAPPTFGRHDVTDQFLAAARVSGMGAREQASIVAAWRNDNVVEVLSDRWSQYWSEWRCEGTPPMVEGVPLRYVTVLYQDHTVMLNCPVG